MFHQAGITQQRASVRLGAWHLPRFAIVLTVRRKILLAFLVMSAITACLGFYAVTGIRTAGRLVVETFDQSLMSIDYARAAAADFAEMEKALARRRLSRTPADTEAMSSLAASFNDDLAIAAERSQSARARDSANRVGAAVAAWLAAQSGSIGRRDEMGSTAEMDRISSQVVGKIDLLINLTAGDGFRHRQRALATIDASARIATAATFAALLLTATITALLARRIMGPLAAASAAAGRIAAGLLDTPIPDAGADELGGLLSAMASMRDHIAAMMNAEIAQRRSAEAMLVDAIESSREGVAVIDAAGRVIIANSQMADFLPHAGRLAPGDDFSQALNASGSIESGELLLADGRWLRVGRSAAQGGRAVVVLSDITALKQQQAVLLQTNQRFDAALNNMSQGLCLFDADHTLLVVNRRLGEIFRLPQERVKAGVSLRELLGLSAAAGNYGAVDPDTLLADRLAELAQGTPATRFIELADERVVAVSTEPMPGGGWLATYDDITARRRAEAQLTFIARHDTLTRLPNRLMLQDRLEQALAQLGRGSGFAVLSIDLDRFKIVNETLGHAIGDGLLRAVAERIGGCIRETDTLARLVGDEFAIVQSGLDRPEDAVKLARRIVEQLGLEFAVDGQALTVGCSVGIALAPHDGTRAEMLLRNADTARTRAKEDGGATYRFFEPAMDAHLQQRRSLELDLRRALAGNEFELFYQPLIDVRRGGVSGFEALIRWWHPERGMVSPAEFIPIAEEIGLIVPMGEWVLRTAAREAAGWPAHVKIAINVSPVQFRSPNLLPAIAAALAESGLPAARMEVEITESVMLSDAEATLALLRRIHDMGVRIAMDDFGTGYSSLSYLRSFPFDKIKIDQSFVRNLSDDNGDLAIVRAVVGLGANLGMRVLAEGVETLQQLDRLRAEGCDEVQGYYFSKPRPAGEIPGIIARLAHADCES